MSSIIKSNTIGTDVYYRKNCIHNMEILIEWLVLKAAKLEFLEGKWGSNQKPSVGGGCGLFLEQNSKFFLGS